MPDFKDFKSLLSRGVTAEPQTETAGVATVLAEPTGDVSKTPRVPAKRIDELLSAYSRPEVLGLASERGLSTDGDIRDVAARVLANDDAGDGPERPPDDSALFVAPVDEPTEVLGEDNPVQYLCDNFNDAELATEAKTRSIDVTGLTRRAVAQAIISHDAAEPAPEPPPETIDQQFPGADPVEIADAEARVESIRKQIGFLLGSNLDQVPVVDTAEQAPGTCCVSGTHEGPFLDLQQDVPHFPHGGRAYISVHTVEFWGQHIGLVKREDVAEVLEQAATEVDTLNRLVRDLEDQLQGLKNGVAPVLQGQALKDRREGAGKTKIRNEFLENENAKQEQKIRELESLLEESTAPDAAGADTSTEEVS